MRASGGRVEDHRLLTGCGRFTDDTAPPEALVARFLRSAHAHGEIRTLDLEAARALPGVVLVASARELDADGVGPIPVAAELADARGERLREPPRPVLAHERVRHVGEAVALVVATSDACARDALEAIGLAIEPRPAVVEARAALAADAPTLHPEVPGNLALDWQAGDPAAVAAAFARAVRIVRVHRRFAPIAAQFLEPRACWARHEAGCTTLVLGSQGVHLQRDLIARTLGWEPSSLRVISEDVGGGFGAKLPVYPEAVAVAWAARKLGRPVRWVAERAEHLAADTRARDLDATLELALDAEGRILALRVDGVAGLGAWLSTIAAIVPTTGLARVISGPYRIPAIAVRLRLAYTNTAPVDAIRGAGKPEAHLLLESALDEAAAASAHDPIALRRRNFLRPDEFPWTTPLGYTYHEPFDTEALLARALELAEHADLPTRRARARARGRLLGFGLACHIHATSALPGETARLALLPDGTVEAWTGTQSQGQGHATVLARIVAEPLGLDPARVRIRQGDTARLATGPGTGGSSSLLVSGSSLHHGARLLAERIRARAAELLEAAPADLLLRAGRVEVVGTDRWIELTSLARRAEEAGAPLAVDQPAVDPVQSWPAGVTTAELEIDPETGCVHLLRLVCALDIGRVFDELLARGQVEGAVALGVGEALVERIVHDPSTGQLVTGTLLDYPLLRAGEVPKVTAAFLGAPARRHPLGVKGLGELPSNGVPAAVASALADALRRVGAVPPDPPATAERLWRALRAAGEPGPSG